MLGHIICAMLVECRTTLERSGIFLDSCISNLYPLTIVFSSVVAQFTWTDPGPGARYISSHEGAIDSKHGSDSMPSDFTSTSLSRPLHLHVHHPLSTISCRTLTTTSFLFSFFSSSLESRPALVYHVYFKLGSTDSNHHPCGRTHLYGPPQYFDRWLSILRCQIQR